MPKKNFTIDGVGAVGVYKRRGCRKIRLRITPDGAVRITLPYWLPYRAAKDFAYAKRAWIHQNQPKQSIIQHDDVIGRQHTVVVSYSAQKNITSRVSDTRILLRVPFGTHIADADIQNTVRSACERALRRQAKVYLPQRLAELAQTHNFSYNTVSIKKMKSRWGSCSSRKNISLNLYLMQLDDALIDYVLLHELVHTRVLSHNAAFWRELSQYVENLSDIRRIMREKTPSIQLQNTSTKD